MLWSSGIIGARTFRPFEALRSLRCFTLNWWAQPLEQIVLTRSFRRRLWKLNPKTHVSVFCYTDNLVPVREKVGQRARESGERIQRDTRGPSWNYIATFALLDGLMRSGFRSAVKLIVSFGDQIARPAWYIVYQKVFFAIVKTGSFYTDEKMVCAFYFR